MKIGIDLDNTIVSYDKLFKEVAFDLKLIPQIFDYNKSKIRNFIIKKSNGKNNWMKIQGLVYGKYMHRAEPMPNILNFLNLCKINNFEIFIVSHKTEYGHFDFDKIPLRKEALKWMKSNRLFDKNLINLKKENIFFANTRKEKVKIISKLKFDWFIDDLMEVFLEKNFPIQTKKILFGKNGNSYIKNNLLFINSWSEIIETIFGKIDQDNIVNWVNSIIRNKINKVKKINSQGNSRLYKVINLNKNSYAVKYYPDKLIDTRERLKIEYNTFRLLHKKNIKNVPKAIKKDEDLNIGIYEWIEGSKLINVKTKDLDQAINFIKKLYLLSKVVNKKEIKLASEACLSARDIINQIESRYNKLNKLKKEYPKLENFLRNNFSPLWKNVKNSSFSIWPKKSRELPLKLAKQTLSPSDFGFHNAIKKNEKITFIDFEYFGWDDPVKLTSDFIWHPAMNLKSNHVRQWINAMLKIFSKDKDFEKRLIASIPLFGMRWIMIILNGFLPKFIESRRNVVSFNLRNKEIWLNEQLKKAIIYCKRVENQINENKKITKFI